MSPDVPPKQSFPPPSSRQDPSFDSGAEPGDSPPPASSDAPGALVSIHAAALKSNADSFPVLKAFQDYLDSERQRARKRMFLLSTFFILTLAIVVGGLLTGGFFVYSRAARHNEALQQTLLELALRTPSPPAPVPASPRIDPSLLAEEFAARLQTVLDRETAPREDFETAERNVRELRDGLEAVKIENERLRDQIGALSNSIPNLAAGLADEILRRIAKESPPKAPSRSTGDSESGRAAEPSPRTLPPSAPLLSENAPGAAAAVPPGYREKTLTLSPPGEAGDMSWRVLIPE